MRTTLKTAPAHRCRLATPVQASCVVFWPIILHYAVEGGGTFCHRMVKSIISCPSRWGCHNGRGVLVAVWAHSKFGAALITALVASLLASPPCWCPLSMKQEPYLAVMNSRGAPRALPQRGSGRTSSRDALRTTEWVDRRNVLHHAIFRMSDVSSD